MPPARPAHARPARCHRRGVHVRKGRRRHRSRLQRSRSGDGGYADVWWRGKFAWEYKRKDSYKDLTEAYRQLCQYREALENPPLLVVCDIARTEIHTNFTGTAKKVHTVRLEDMDTPEGLSILRRVFTDPESFRPTTTIAKVTEQIAGEFASPGRPPPGARP